MPGTNISSYTPEQALAHYGLPTREPMSAHVLVFGRRHDASIHALMRSATEKRQGTKSREVVHLRCSGLYGVLNKALVLEIK
jgi:hypothetical protein